MERLKSIIDSFEAKPEKQFQDFINHLVNKEVYPVVRQNKDGMIYGVTFVDNTTKCVFNGSTLGKQYSAQGIQNRFKVDANSKTAMIPRFPVKEDGELATRGVNDASARIEGAEMIRQLTEVNVDHSNTPYELKKKKKRRGRSI